MGIQRASGALIVRVTDGGPAAQAGLKASDVITAIDGTEISDPRTALYRLTTKGIGGLAKLDVVRQGRPLAVELALRSPPQPGRDDVRNLSGAHPFEGARVANLLPGVAEELGLEEGEGVVVMSVRPGSAAARVGLEPGDVIVQVGAATPKTVVALEQALQGRPRVWQLAVRRGDQVLQVQVPG
jgi:S1-C subfamily serine protease